MPRVRERQLSAPEKMISQSLRLIRAYYDISVGQMADCLKITYITYRRIEQARSSGYRYLDQITTAFHIPTDKIMAGLIQLPPRGDDHAVSTTQP
jgi:transcriptional regulator with XRE-family HTH domain